MSYFNSVIAGPGNCRFIKVGEICYYFDRIQGNPLLRSIFHMGKSQYLASLNAEQWTLLEQKLLVRQGGQCFICEQPIDLMLHKGQLDIDHIDPLIEEGLDAENNFALTHSACNRSKGAANLEIARRLSEFERLQTDAHESGKRGANLGDVLARHNGAKFFLRLRRAANEIEFSLPDTGDNSIHKVPIYHDKLSSMDSFFTALPLEYLHHDDRINPRSIGFVV
jgi:HNH endonuclease